MKKIDGQTPDLVAARVEELHTVFPEVFKDGKVDFDALQNILGEYVEDAREKYSFTWAGKLDAIRLAQKRSTGTLRPCKEESVNFDTTQNLYIEGDNLEVLKLLSGSYMNSVKMIYIDPPYNTGNDFVYADDFSDGIEHYKKVIGETAKSNAETAGRYHTNWLNMMLPRLKLARVLLKQDGVIFISIDDNEVYNLKKLCDEVFGENNYINQFAWINNLTGRQISGVGAAKTNEYVLAYAKNIDNISIFDIDVNFAKAKMPDAYKGFKKDVRTDERGEFAIGDTLWNHNRIFNEESRPNLVYSIFYSPTTGKIISGNIGEKKDGFIELLPHKNGDGVHKYHAWRWSRQKVDSESYDLIVLPVTNGYEIYTKSRNFTKTTLKDIITNISNGELEVRAIFGGCKYFDYPKSVDLLQLFISAVTTDNDIILDFFSGSGTTAHAVVQANAEDGGNRKFICVQIPELTDESSEAFKAGYKTICEIGKERIRRAGKKIKDESPMLTANLDTGFKVFKLDTSNLKKWNNGYTRDYGQLALRVKDHYEYLTPDRTVLDMVYEIMLKYSLPLTLPVEKIETNKITAHIISHAGDDTAEPFKVLVCLDEGLTLEQMEALSALGCGTLFFADRCFTDTNAMTNCDEILKKAGQEMRLF